MAAGALTAETLAKTVLAQAAAIDRAGPRLNSVLELNPPSRADTLAPAPSVARDGRADRCTSAVMLLKDNIESPDDTATTGAFAARL